MKTALLYFSAFSQHVGGSETLVFSLIEELQQRGYAVTLALSGGGDVSKVAAQYDSKIDLAALKVIYLSKASGVLAKLNRKLRFLWKRRLRQIGRQYDVCISCSNPVDFGRPGIHFVHMMTLDAGYYNKVWYRDQNKRVPLKERLAQMRDELGRILAGARPVRKILRDPREVVLPNSNYVKRSIEAYYGGSVHAAFYPPTLFVPEEQKLGGESRSTIDVACLGRVGPEKKVIEIIGIVEKARELSGKNLRLRIAGHVPPDHSYTDYGTRVRALAKERPWIILEGTLTGEAKAKYLASCRFAVHYCEVEAFGISITEYLKSGLVPIVPEKGGSSEVVGMSELVFNTPDRAASLLAKLSACDKFYDTCRQHCKDRSNVFSASNYVVAQQRLLDQIL